MAALIGVLVIQIAAAGVCAGGLCDADRLKPFFEALHNTRGGTEPVRIIQIGDSHTAGDQISGAWRTLLQARYGSGGRGVLPPGRPYQGYVTGGITARQSGDWSVAGIFGAAFQVAGPVPIGLSGYSLSTSQPGASMSLEADSTEAFNRFTVCAMRGPNAGTLSLTIASTVLSWPLSDDIARPDCRFVESSAESNQATLTVLKGPVTVTSWSTERRGSGGVTLSNLGTVGAQLVHFNRTNEAVVERELQEYRPDLIVVAFGTNEAFRSPFTALGYDEALKNGLERVRRLAPGVPIMVLGAPDSATKLSALQSGESGPSRPCQASRSAPDVAREESPASPKAANDPQLWRPTAALALVQTITQARSHDIGFAYWDWSGRMGGRCTADAWARSTPPLMRADHVHFTTKGAAIVAGLLDHDLENYAASLAAPTASEPQ